jgi:hypothetical protein
MQTLIDEDDDDEMWLRRLTLPEEYLCRHHPELRGGYYRWFKSSNVVDLVRVRRLRSGQQRSPQSDHEMGGG